MLSIHEIFYSLQGEGAQTGIPSIFIRLSGCNLSCSYCDTDFSAHFSFSLEELLQEISQYPCRHIIWTGGEPTLQLTEEVTLFFRNAGYRQSIETNGTRPLPRYLDYITCSPKPEALARLTQTLPFYIDEIRWPLGKNTPLPPSRDQLPKATHYCVSPIQEPNDPHYPTQQSWEMCLQYVKEHPDWRLSLQTHKLLGIQ